MHEYKLHLQPNISPANIKKKLSTFFNVEINEGIISITLKSPNTPSCILNEKETLVLEYMSEGMRYSEIAEKMGFTVNGSRFYVKKIYKKFNVDNSIKAINKGRQLGIIQ